MEKMKAMLVGDDHTLVWSDVDMPKISDDEVLVKIHAAGVNRADILQRQGKYPSPAGCPPWPGLEIAGEIVKLGENAKKMSDLAIGNRVCALLGGGGYSQYAAVKYDMLIKLADGVSYETAAAFPEAYATSYLNLFIEAQLETCDTVYIAAGASGLASAAIPMAKAFGAKVITSIIDESKRSYVEALGADIIVNTASESLKDVFCSLEQQGTPAKIAMDCLSGDMLGECLQYMARGGYWVVISTLAGIETKVLLRPLLTKGLHLVGSMLRNRTPETKAKIMSELSQRVMPLVANGTLKPHVCEVVPITDAIYAHGLLEQNKSVGKVVLSVE